MTKTEKVLICFFTLTTAIGAYVGFDLVKGTPEEQRIMSACRDLKPGIGRASLIAALGSPKSTNTDRDIEILLFPTPFVMGGDVSAKVNLTSGKVVELSCGEEGVSVWKIQ